MPPPGSKTNRSRVDSIKRRRAETGRRLVVNLLSATEDEFHGQGVHTAFLQTRDSLRRAGVDVLVNSSEWCDIVHVQTVGLMSLSALLRNRGRTVVTAHVVPESFIGSLALARAWLPIGTAYLKFFYDSASAVVAVSPDVVHRLAEMGVTTPVRFIPNAVDCARFRADPDGRKAIRERLSIDPEAFVAIGAGQIQPRKGLNRFVGAARALPDMTFVWAGDMPFKRLTAGYDRMMDLVADAPPNCLFVGGQPHEEMPRWYSAADCLFFPSRQETFGLAVIEAAAAGLPLLLRDLETYRLLFGDAIITTDGEGFVPWLVRLRDDPELRAHYSRAALELALRYDADRLVEGLLEMYGGVLASGRPTRSTAPAVHGSE